MTNIILCGGSGTRLWPLSRSSYPKQFVELVDGRSLFQATVARNASLCSATEVVANGQHVFLAADQYRAAGVKGKASFILEPVGRNTAPAIAFACLNVPEDEVVLVSPSDHLILDQAAYEDRVSEAEDHAMNEYLVTFGIKPEYPETGYGYIEVSTESLHTENAHAVRSFREKPDRVTAEAYIRESTFLWNSGMFVFKAGAFLRELQNFAPALHDAAKAAYTASKKEFDEGIGYDVLRIGKESMEAIPSDSIDYAVMEKSPSVACIASSFAWNDLGSFDALYDISAKDANGNTSAPNLVQSGSRGNLIVGDKRPVALVDMEGCIVVDTPDALLVTRRGSSQGVKKIVETLKARGPKDVELTELPATVRRPWGDYTCLDECPGFKIKRIVVKPGKKLSLQKHFRRSEHWVVVRGQAIVTHGEALKALGVDESVYIPVGCLHRLENQGKEDLVIIETQVGDYLEEDDIVRVEDVYGRV